jgi:AcrR family transcriptional regulator
MRYDPEHKEETRRKILEGTHRGFRKKGFDGAGVDSLASESGLTSGAFYKNFKSKVGAFRASISLGVGDFQKAVAAFQEEHGEKWLDKFARFYLGEKRCTDLSDSCALQSLTSEVTRLDSTTKGAFEEALIESAKTFSEGLPSSDGEIDDRAWADLALLVGGATLARAVKDPALADTIAKAAHKAIIDHSEKE